MSQNKTIKEKKPPKKITASYLKNSGTYYLQKFPASRAHFEFIMMRKIRKSIEHHESPTLEEAQDLLTQTSIYFEELGYLNDRQYALVLSRSLFRKGASPKVLSQRLRIKGINDDIISECLETVLPPNADLIAALYLIKRRRYGAYASQDIKKDSKKILGVLARAGFSYHIAQQVIDMSLDEANETLNNIAP